MNDESNTDFRLAFKQLVADFERIAVGFEKIESKFSIEEAGMWCGVDVGDARLRRHAIARCIADCRKAVASAGSLCIDAYDGGFLSEVDGLDQLMAAMELKDWNGLVHCPANLFALLVGGPAIELHDRTGGSALMEKPKAGFPIQYRPVSHPLILSPPLELHAAQCRTYSKFCQSAAERLPRADLHEGKWDDSADHTATSAPAPRGYDDPKMEERDGWIYKMRTTGKRNQEVIGELAKIFADRQWEHITTPRGILDAVKRYCSQTGADPPPVDKGGRPKG